MIFEASFVLLPAGGFPAPLGQLPKSDYALLVYDEAMVFNFEVILPLGVDWRVV